jgi:protein TonB
MNQDILKSSLDDIVFEGRNKAYGAYVLRKLYNKHLTRGSLLGILFFLLLTFSPYIAGKLSEIGEVDELAMKEVVLSEPPPVDPKKPPPPPPPPKPEPPPPVKQIKFLPPQVKEDKDVKEEEPPPLQTELDTAKAQFSNRNVQGADDKGSVAPPPPPPPPPPPDDPEPVKEDEVLNIVEQMPSFPDGEAAMFKFLQENIKYPDFCRENGIEGTAIIGFVVEKDGRISNVSVLRGVKGGKQLDDEAMRVIGKMPRWTPGRQNGRDVRVNFRVPVKFKLQ